MKKIKNLLPLLVLSSIFLFSSCETEDSADTSENSEDSIDADWNTDEEVEEISILCEGNGSQDPLPLAIGNRWYFKKTLGGSNLEITINEKVEINGKQYFKIEYKGEFSDYEEYYRKASNGDVYELLEFIDGTQKEYLLIPNNPVNNQEWEYIGLLNDQDYVRRVRIVNQNFPIRTDNCEYDKYIIVDEMSVATSPLGNNEIITNKFYVRGIGFQYAQYRQLTELKLN